MDTDLGHLMSYKNRANRHIKRIFAFILTVNLLITIGNVRVFCTSGSEEQRIVIHRKHENNEMKIALTFDDGPHPRYTPKILEILKKYNIKATFFSLV